MTIFERTLLSKFAPIPVLPGSVCNDSGNGIIVDSVSRHLVHDNGYDIGPHAVESPDHKGRRLPAGLARGTKRDTVYRKTICSGSGRPSSGRESRITRSSSRPTSSDLAGCDLAPLHAAAVAEPLLRIEFVSRTRVGNCQLSPIRNMADLTILCNYSAVAW